MSQDMAPAAQPPALRTQQFSLTPTQPHATHVAVKLEQKPALPGNQHQHPQQQQPATAHNSSDTGSKGSPSNSNGSKPRKRSRSPGHRQAGATPLDNGTLRAPNVSAFAAASAGVDRATAPAVIVKSEGRQDGKIDPVRFSSFGGAAPQYAKELWSKAVFTTGTTSPKGPGSAPFSSRPAAATMQPSGSVPVGVLEGAWPLQQSQAPLHTQQAQQQQQQQQRLASVRLGVSPDASRRSTPAPGSAPGGSCGGNHDPSAAEAEPFAFPASKRRSSVGPMDVRSGNVSPTHGLDQLTSAAAALAAGILKDPAVPRDASGRTSNSSGAVGLGRSGSAGGSAEAGERYRVSPGGAGSMEVEVDAGGAAKIPAGGPRPLALPLPPLKKKLSPSQVEAALQEVAEAVCHKPRGRPIKYISLGINRMAMKIHVGLQLGDRIESVGGCDSHEAAAMLQDLTFIGLGLYVPAGKAAAPHPTTRPAEHAVPALTYPASYYHSGQVQRVVAQLINRKLLPEGELHLSHARAIAAGCTPRPIATTLLQALTPEATALPSSSHGLLGNRPTRLGSDALQQLTLGTLPGGYMQHAYTQVGPASAPNVNTVPMASNGAMVASDLHGLTIQRAGSMHPGSAYMGAAPAVVMAPPQGATAAVAPAGVAPPGLTPAGIANYPPNVQGLLVAGMRPPSAPAVVGGVDSSNAVVSAVPGAQALMAPPGSAAPAIAQTATALGPAPGSSGITGTTSAAAPMVTQAWQLVQGPGGQTILQAVPIDGTNQDMVMSAPGSLQDLSSAAMVGPYGTVVALQQAPQGLVPEAYAVMAQQHGPSQGGQVIHPLGQAVYQLSEQQQHLLLSQQHAPQVTSLQQLQQLHQFQQPTVQSISAHTLGAATTTSASPQLPGASTGHQSQLVLAGGQPGITQFGQGGPVQVVTLGPGNQQFVSHPGAGDHAALFVQPPGNPTSLGGGRLAPAQEQQVQLVHQQPPPQQQPGSGQVVANVQGQLVALNAAGQVVAVLPAQAANEPAMMHSGMPQAQQHHLQYQQHQPQQRAPGQGIQLQQLMQQQLMHEHQQQQQRQQQAAAPAPDQPQVQVHNYTPEQVAVMAQQHQQAQQLLQAQQQQIAMLQQQQARQQQTLALLAQHYKQQQQQSK